MLDKILVPLDGSSLGELTLSYAAEVASPFNSQVQLVYVCEKHDSEYCRTVQAYLDKVAGEMRNIFIKTASQATVEPELLQGKPATEIIQYAQQKEMDLVLIASHGRTGIKAWVMGSTANKVVHLIHQPTLLVRASVANAEKRPVNLFHKILVPLDGSENGEAVLPYIIEMALKLKSEIMLLSVVELSERVHTIGGLDYIHFPEYFIDSMKKDSENYLAGLSKKLMDKGIVVQNEVREGNAAEEIVTFGNENNISLIAMSSHGKSDSREWVMGSVANKILHVSKLPVLLVRSAPVKQ